MHNLQRCIVTVTNAVKFAWLLQYNRYTYIEKSKQSYYHQQGNGNLAPVCYSLFKFLYLVLFDVFIHFIYFYIIYFTAFDFPSYVRTYVVLFFIVFDFLMYLNT